MKRFIWLPVAGFLLVAGAAVAAAAPGVINTASSLVGVGTAALDDGGIVVDADGRGGLLDEVLAELVTDGLITQEQSDAITEALTTRAEERRADFEAEREQLRAMWEQIQGFLEDGVISADEIAQLPDDNPFSAIEGILEDGQVTVEELQSLRPFGGFREGPGFGSGPGGRGGHDDHRRPGRAPGMWLPVDPGTPEIDPNVDPPAAPSSKS